MPSSAKRSCMLLAVILILAGCSSRAATLMREAENLWFQNRYKESVRIFLQIADRYPGSKEAEISLLRVGETFMLNLSDQEKAVEYFTRLTLEYPRGQKVNAAREAIASIYETSLKDYERAVIQYQKLIESGNPEKKDKYQFAIGRSYYRKGNFRQAIIEYQTFLGRYPGSDLVPEAEYQIGNCYFVMNRCGDAVKQYEMVMEEYPDINRRGDILLSIGVCMEEKDEYGRALSIYRDIVETYPNRELIQKKIDSVVERMKSKNR